MHFVRCHYPNAVDELVDTREAVRRFLVRLHEAAYGVVIDERKVNPEQLLNRVKSLRSMVPPSIQYPFTSLMDARVGVHSHKVFNFKVEP